MKTYFLLITFTLVFFNLGYTQKKNSTDLLTQNSEVNSFTKPTPAGIQENWYNEATSKIEALQYAFHSFSDNKFAAVNAANLLRFDIQSNGYSVKNINAKSKLPNWQTSFSLLNISRGQYVWTPENHLATIDKKQKLTYQSKNFAIEFVNDKNGLRQNFIVNKKQKGEGELSLNIALGNEMKYELQGKNKLLCFSNDNAKTLQLFYDDLKVWDANGKALTAYMKMSKNNVLSLMVNDKNAVYPITVDPLSHVPEWTTSADGVLPGLLTNLQLQVDALYGINVAALGDINGDGFDDVAIGAPGAIDIIGATTVVSAGAVFVYLGSSDGLSTTPSKILRATTPVTNALFGFSIAGGNVTGNSWNDIVVSAPAETYTANVGGAPSTANVTAGKVYVFSGEDLATANPTPLLSIYLNGSTYFTRGVLGVIGSNISVNALFGFSVAVTDDLGSDGLGEIIVGAPGYAEIGGLLAVRSGAAFVYNSTNLASNTPVKLTAPSASLLGLPISLDNSGLLFGFSVDGAGDYNQDGHPDVVVGAPAGVTLTLGNLLGGSAYVYNGTGSGVNTTFGTQLTATPSLIGTLANLFGYSVKGVCNANTGLRDGSILVGAPSGNVLSNILSGLKLKTGSVNVFVHKASPGSSQLPTQQLPSPRGNSLLSILAGQNLSVAALFGASMDNMLDVNCDGINDIIVGEPLSTGVGLISANAVGGAADVFLGKTDGTFATTPYWSLENVTSFDVGINAGSLLGYSVAGARHIRGGMQGVRALIGAPGAALDFGSGILNLGNTVGTLFSFTAGNNGLGKAYIYDFSNCGVHYNPDLNVTYVDVPVPGNTSANDEIPSGTTYSTPIPNPSNPAVATIDLQSDGNYIFTTSVQGVYNYSVPVCLPNQVGSCTPVNLKITVLSNSATTNPPVANTDIAATLMNTPVSINSLINDKCSNGGCSLNASTVTVITNPKNGTTSTVSLTGNIIYTPNNNFVGYDTLMYQVYDNGSPAKSATAMQIVSVLSPTLSNSTMAADDYNNAIAGTTLTGNVKLNDTDPQGDIQTVGAQAINIPNVGLYTLLVDGSYVFVPLANFSGPVDLPYSTCDNGSPTACAKATLHLLLKPLSILPVSLTDFKYVTKDCGVQIYWSTQQELNTKNYVIENSIDNRTWTPVATVTAKGNITTKTDYSFNLSSATNGQNYFRLAIHDNTGIIQYSNVITPFVSCNGGTKVTVMPNPFIDKLNVRFTTQNGGFAEISLTDATGKQILSTKVVAQKGDNNMFLNNLSVLSSGLYIITIKTDEKVFTQKILK